MLSLQKRVVTRLARLFQQAHILGWIPQMNQCIVVFDRDIINIKVILGSAQSLQLQDGREMLKGSHPIV